MRDTAAAAEIDLLRETLARTGSAWVRQAGASMAPLLRPDDALRLVPLDPTRARRGMVVGIASEGRLVVHRLVRVGPDGLVARGDALPAADAPVAREALVGRVVGLSSPDGCALDFARSLWLLAERLLGALA
ncbi:MAG: S24/S26 family peptidase, partial [Candidatus Rokuibacteriota bacterium]